MAHLLLIEANTALGPALRRRLQGAGHTVTLIATETQVVPMIQIRPPDLILLDTRLPSHMGFRVVQHLKEQPESQGVPIIMLLARLDAAAPEAGAPDDGDALLDTRLDVPEFLRVIATMAARVALRRGGG